MMKTKIPQERILMTFLAGSHLYGTNIPTSDKDYVSVFMPTEKELLGLKHVDIIEDRTNPSGSGIRNKKEDTDHTYYSLSKFIYLVVKCNPNMLELVFANEKCITNLTSIGKEILDNASNFVSLRARESFLGYSKAQRHRLLIKKENMTGRKEIAKKFGYDTKFGMHLIRLLTEGATLMKEGRIFFPLPNRKFLLDVRNGKFTLEELSKEVEHLEKVFDLAFASSKLPKFQETTFPFANNLLVKLIKDFYGYPMNIGTT